VSVAMCAQLQISKMIPYHLLMASCCEKVVGTVSHCLFTSVTGRSRDGLQATCRLIGQALSDWTSHDCYRISNSSRATLPALPLKGMGRRDCGRGGNRPRNRAGPVNRGVTRCRSIRLIDQFGCKCHAIGPIRGNWPIRP
jgi:hypothetical protein